MLNISVDKQTTKQVDNKTMGAKVSSLQDIKNLDIEVFLLKKIKVHEYYNGIQLELKETSFDMKILYDGSCGGGSQLTSEFAEVMSDKLIEYVDSNFSVLSQTMLFAMIWIRELSYAGFGHQARRVASELTKHKLFRGNHWYLENSLLHITDDELFHIIALPYYYDVKRSVGSKYNNVGLNYCTTVNQVLFYTDSLSIVFNDKYVEQFKLLFIHNKTEPYDFIMSRQHQLDESNNNCLLWLLTVFKFSTEQVKCIIETTHKCNYDLFVVMDGHITTADNSNKQFYKQLFWSSPEWRRKLISYLAVSKSDLELDIINSNIEDSIIKSNIIVFEFSHIN